MKVNALIFAGFFIPLVSLATPTLYPNSPADLSRIKNETTSNIIGDTDSDSTIYVMPPNVGTAKASGIHSQSASVALCEQLPLLARQSTNYLKIIETLEVKHSESLGALNFTQEKILKAKEDLANHVASSNLKEFDGLNDDLDETRAQIDAKRAALGDCAGEACDSLKVEIAELLKLKAVYTKARADFLVKNLKAARIYNQKKAVVEALREELNARQENFEKISADIRKAKERVDAQFFAFDAIVGARAAFSFETPWDENLEKLRAANSGINFAKLNTSNAVIFPQLEAFPNVRANPIIGMDIVGGDATANKKGIHFSSFPGTVQTNVVLNLFGYCPIARPDLFPEARSSIDPNNMRYSVVASYEFPSSMRLEMKAKYNLRSLYTKSMESWKRGGFFRSRSGVDVKESEKYDDAFKVEWTEQDPENRLSEEKRAQMEQDAKNELLERIARIGLANVKNTAPLASLPATDPRGAAVMAGSLLKACPANIWCVAGSGILATLDSIFGSSSSSVSTESIANVTAEEIWQLNQVVMKPWVTSYKFQ
jgi:hypothetical protein